MERRKVLRREVAATICGSLLPKYPFTDVILQTRSCGSPRKCSRDILQHKNQPSSKIRCVLITHFHFPLSQQGHKLVPKYCRKSVKIFSSCSARTPLRWENKAEPLLLMRHFGGLLCGSCSLQSFTGGQAVFVWAAVLWGTLDVYTHDWYFKMWQLYIYTNIELDLPS